MDIVDNKYHQWYTAIIANARTRAIDLGQKYEIHHVVPWSLGGDNSDSNLVALTLKEHWVCHRLLVKFLADPVAVRKMYNALWMMLQKDYRTVNARLYKSVKENAVVWNKDLKGNYPYPNKTPEHVKVYLSELHMGKKRKPEDIAKMKLGWERIKKEGYTPWNKGKSIAPTRSTKCTLVSPAGEEFSYNSQKEGCLALGLPPTKMSSVKTGKLAHYKGWTFK